MADLIDKNNAVPTVTNIGLQLLLIAASLAWCFGCDLERINWWLNGCCQHFLDTTED